MVCGSMCWMAMQDGIDVIARHHAPRTESGELAGEEKRLFRELTIEVRLVRGY